MKAFQEMHGIFLTGFLCLCAASHRNGMRCFIFFGFDGLDVPDAFLENEKRSAEMGKDMEEILKAKRRYEKIGDCLVFYLTEDLDHHTADKFREISDYLIEKERVKNIIFDFTGVSFMDSSGIGMLMGRYKKVMFLEGRAAVTGVGDVVDRIFLLSGVYKIIEKYDTTEEALAELST